MPDIVCRVVDCHVFTMRNRIPYYLLLKRSSDVVYAGSWRMVGGKIEQEEKAWQTAQRELKEETGLQIEKLWAVPFVNQFYEPDKDRVNVIPVFAAQVREGVVTLSPEHSEYKWATFEETFAELPWPAQKEGLRIAHEFIVDMREVSGFLEIKLQP